MKSQLPSLLETATGCFLHDIGKLLQRGGGSSSRLPLEVRSLESVILPVFEGRYTHKHALWTEAFFQQMPAFFPQGMNASRVREVAVYHHNPDTPCAAICTEADRLASGMDRKQKDMVSESQEGGGSWSSFLTTPLRCCYDSVDLGLGKPAAHATPLGILSPSSPPMPENLAAIQTADYPLRYAELWRQMKGELESLGASDSGPDVFCESLISISERFLSGVPSSTMDVPDISLHDHARAVAAVGAALYRFHACQGTLEDRPAIQNRHVAKFRFLAGDLSGIQASLFRLANQRVRGVNRILRARSFLISMLLEGAALACLKAFGLPGFSLIQNAGGRFLILVPNLPDSDQLLQNVRVEVERYLWDRYTGEIAINLALSAPFAGSELMREKFSETLELSEIALSEAKLRAFSSIENPIHNQSYPNGPCSACAARPGAIRKTTDAGDAYFRCASCDDEERLGQALPGIRYIGWSEIGADPAHSLTLFSGLHLAWFDRPPRIAACLSVFRIHADGNHENAPVATRFLATYVPKLQGAAHAEPRYRGLSDEARDAHPGDLKTFEHLAADALEPDSASGELLGEPLLAILKADVDRLGRIFSSGIRDATLGRTAAISRSTDFFFTAHLTELIRTQYPDTYTVYAGGDDLLLIGPWNSMLALAAHLRLDFARWTGANPNITLSAGLELMKSNQPVNSVVRRAEERLEAAKDAGRDRICALDSEPVSWSAMARQIEWGDRLSSLLRAKKLSQSFVYRLLYFQDQKRLAEGPATTPEDQDRKLNAAGWRAKWGYQLARHLDRDKDREIVTWLCELLGLNQNLSRNLQTEPTSARAAITMALYRNRSRKESR